MSNNGPQVKAAIDALIMMGGQEVSLRDSIHEAVQITINNPLYNPREIHAIILIGDRLVCRGGFCSYSSGNMDR